jgi:hypothetical protein
MKMKSSLAIALFIGAIGSYSGYAFDNIDGNSETQVSAETQSGVEQSPEQSLEQGNFEQASPDMEAGGGHGGGGGGVHGGGGGGFHPAPGGGEHGGGGFHPTPVHGDPGHGGGGYHPDPGHGGGGFHPAPGHPGQGWPDHGGFHDGHGWHPGPGMGHIHYDPIDFHHGGYYWPHWDAPFWARPIYYWNWATLHAVTCVSADSVGDEYTVTEDGYSGLVYQGIINQVEDASMDRCYNESGEDPGCHLVACTPVY